MAHRNFLPPPVRSKHTQKIQYHHFSTLHYVVTLSRSHNLWCYSWNQWPRWPMAMSYQILRKLVQTPTQTKWWTRSLSKQTKIKVNVQLWHLKFSQRCCWKIQGCRNAMLVPNGSHRCFPTAFLHLKVQESIKTEYELWNWLWPDLSGATTELSGPKLNPLHTRIRRRCEAAVS